jgi:hypothetical protein
MLPTWTYVKSTDSIYVNLFIGSTVTVEDVAGTDVEMVQVTDYPWSGEVSISVNPAVQKKFSVKVRLPNRSVSDLYTSQQDTRDKTQDTRLESGVLSLGSLRGITSISVNGSAITPPIEKGYAVITRNWKAGDKIDLVLPMKVQRIKGSGKIAATRGQVALRYGPLIYNVEQVDQDITKVLRPESVLTAEWKGDLLGGVIVIKGTWADGSTLTAIPNYVRNNRDADAAERVGGFGRRPVSSIVWMRDQ